ncbi:MAG TPA: hypothetical protein VIM48_04550, partial [Chthoniobacterales bacterium]
SPSGENFFAQFDPPQTPLTLPDWVVNPAPASWGDPMQLVGIGMAQNNVQPASGGSAGGTACWMPSPLPSSAPPQASPPPAPKVLYSRFILGMKNAFGGDYGRTRQWFADNGYSDLLQPSAPSQPSLFDRYWTMLDQYDRDKQQADDARKVGFWQAFGREGIRGLSGITKLEERALLPMDWGIDAASKALTGYDPQFSAGPDNFAQQRNSLAIQPEEELTTLGKIGQASGQALPVVLTAPLAEAAAPEEVLTTVGTEAPTVINTIRALASKIPKGIAAMTPAAGLAAQDVADQGGSLGEQAKTAALTAGMGAIPFMASSGASSLPARILERAAKSAALSIPINAEVNNLMDPNRRTTTGFTWDDAASAIPRLRLALWLGEGRFLLCVLLKPSERRNHWHQTGAHQKRLKPIPMCATCLRKYGRRITSSRLRRRRKIGQPCDRRAMRSSRQCEGLWIETTSNSPISEAIAPFELNPLLNLRASCSESRKVTFSAIATCRSDGHPQH